MAELAGSGAGIGWLSTWPMISFWFSVEPVKKGVSKRLALLQEAAMPAAITTKAA